MNICANFIRIPSLIYRAEIKSHLFEVVQQEVVKRLHFVYQLIKRIGQILLGIPSETKMQMSEQAAEDRPPPLNIPSNAISNRKFHLESSEPMTPDRPISTPFNSKEGGCCSTPPRRQPFLQTPNSPERASPTKSLPASKRKQIEKTMRKLFQEPQDQVTKSPSKGLAKVDEEEAQVVVNGWSGLLEWESDSKNLNQSFEI